MIGFDIERHEYGDHRYPGQLVLQDVRTLHGSQFKDATLIVASPPCQAYSYRAMPWKKAKALPPPCNALFEACFRIQREACEAAGRHIPLIVENVRGAQKWVGRARWNFGSFYLWGDVPALMPMTLRAVKVGMGSWRHPDADRNMREDGVKGAGPRRDTVTGKVAHGMKRWTNPAEHDDAIKLGGSWFHGYRQGQGPRNHGSKSKGRKMASAMIAKIPQPLARHIAATFRVSVDML